MMIILLLLVIYFCHIKLTSYVQSNQNIIEVPPAIYKHLMFYSNQMVLVDGSNGGLASNIITYIQFDNSKYYLRSKNSFSSPPYMYLFGFYVLKDI